ncbi:MAG: glycosyltransferase family 39 protein [Polyangiaceae bacterium]
MALGLRATSLTWGLPYLYHPDEPITFLVIQHMLKNHTLNPHFFRYPSLFFYLNAVVQLGHYAVCHALGIVHSLAELPELDVPIDGAGFTSLPSAFLAGRALSTVAATATVWVSYRIGRTLSGDSRVGAVAALLVAVSPVFLRHSRWLAPDGLASLAATATVLASLKLLRYGRARDYVLACLLAGAAASLKYNAAIVAVTIWAAAVLRDRRRFFRNPWFWAAPFITGSAFLLTTPYAVLDFGGFWHDFMRERTHYARGHAGAEGNTVAFYCSYLWSQEGAGSVLSLGGILLGLRRKDPGVAVLATFVAVYFAFINLFVTRNDQTIVPVVPTVLVLAAWFSVQCFVALEARFARKVSKTTRSLAAAVLLLSLTAYPFRNSFANARSLLRKDNRELARVWLEEHIAPHSRVVIERYSCYIDRRRYQVKHTLTLSQLTPDWIRDHEDYAVVAGDTFSRFLQDSARYRRQASRDRAFFRKFILMQQFDDPRGGAEVRIYQTRPHRPQ